jgi:6-pyruvoyltetrahydropterin/6-carboxytetrahydropterin synthase
MTNIRVTKEFDFEMAHALHGYQGACKNIHGHSYHLSVCLLGKVLNNPEHSENGMVIDFSKLKKIVKTQVIEDFDHALMLNEDAAKAKSFTQPPFEKTLLMPFQPTCENLLIEIVRRIKPHLPPNTTLHHVRLRETSGSFAEWFAEDNNQSYERLNQ